MTTTATPRLPKPPAEVPPNRTLDGLAPKFRAALERVLQRMRALGFDPIIFETLRTDARQRFLFGFGRSYDDGRGIVTHSLDCWGTWHRFGLAADIISASKQWGASDAFWKALGEACRAEGLLWGNDWDGDGIPVELDPDERLSDRPHVQWGKPMRRSPSALARELLQKYGVAEVWRTVRAA